MIKDKYKTTDNVELYFELHGDVSKPLIIWSHGFTGSARNWRSTIRKLPDLCHLIYDMRGHARSDAPANPQAYCLERLTQDVLEILEFYKEELGASQKVYLAGLSLGAMLTYNVSQTIPDTIAGLILSSLPDPTVSSSISAKAIEFSKAILTDGLEAAGEVFVWGKKSGMTERDSQLVKQGFLEHSSHGIAYLLQEVLSRLPSSELMAQGLAQLNKPVLILAGLSDKNAVDYSSRVVASLPESAVPMVSYCPIAGEHLLNLTSGQLFCDQVQKFLNS